MLVVARSLSYRSISLALVVSLGPCSRRSVLADHNRYVLFNLQLEMMLALKNCTLILQVQLMINVGTSQTWSFNQVPQQ